MSSMDTSMSIIRFLMFIIFVVIVLFKILTMKYSSDDKEEPSEVSYGTSEKDDAKDDEKDDAKDDATGDENDTTDTFSYINKEDDEGDKSEQSNKSSTTNMQWEKALKYDKKDNGEYEEYQYTSDDVDKLTLMSSDDMIFCLKNDNTCAEMKFEKCKNAHIGTYMDETSCLNAKTVMSTKEYCLENGSCNVIEKSDSCGTKIRYATKEKCEDANIIYCNINGKCSRYSDVSCTTPSTYNTMNECKAGESLTQDEGEYCLYEDACNTIDVGETCKGRYYTSLEMCKKNNIEYCLDKMNQCKEIQKNEPCSNRFFDIKCENSVDTVTI